MRLVILFFYFSIIKTLAKSVPASVWQEEEINLKSWNVAISKYIQLDFLFRHEKAVNLLQMWNLERINVKFL